MLTKKQTARVAAALDHMRAALKCPANVREGLRRVRSEMASKKTAARAVERLEREAFERKLRSFRRCA